MSFSKLIHQSSYHTCCFRNVKNQAFRLFLRHFSLETRPEEIIVPKRIPRGPTDILRAIASTVKRDPTAAHYKYHDDPYLIPISNSSKRIYALSQESGRKAAMWIREQNPELFQHKEADPPIEAFFPRAIYDENDDLNEDILKKLITSVLVSDAIHVYNLMLKKGIELSEEIKLSMFEMLCFFNEQEQLSEELIEERWFSQNSKEKKVIRKTWKDGSLADKLFEELPPTGRTYSALIQGKVKFYDIDGAVLCYEEAQEKGLVLSVDAFNAVIGAIHLMKDGPEQRYQLLMQLFSTMNDQGIVPNVGTLNAGLKLMCSSLNYRNTKQNALKLMAEMKKFDVEPSLASYYYLLTIFCNDVGPKSYILNDILNYTENKEFQIQHPDDTMFFVTAMEKCRYHLQDKDLAYRVNDLLMYGSNYNFIGNSYRESVYYRHFFVIMCRSETLEETMNLYNHYVPNIYTPEISVMDELIKAVTMNGAIDLYARLWSDIMLFDLFNNDKLVSTLIQGMALNRSPFSNQPSEVAVKLADIAWNIFEKNEEAEHDKQYASRMKLVWTGQLLGDLMLLLNCAGELDKSAQILHKLIKHPSEIIGVPQTETLATFIDLCVWNQKINWALDCIEYCVENGYGEVDSLAKKIVRGFTLGPASTNKLITLVGSDVLKKDDVDEEPDQSNQTEDSKKDIKG